MKPLRRSVTFWCGLFVHIFLCWLGMMSIYRTTYINFPATGSSEVSLQILGGLIVVQKWEGFRAHPARSGMIVMRPDSDWEGWFPAIYQENQYSGGRSRFWRVPLILLLPSYSLLWLGLMRLSRRREARISRAREGGTHEEVKP
jgi:hypothetical protein